MSSSKDISKDLNTKLEHLLKAKELSYDIDRKDLVLRINMSLSTLYFSLKNSTQYTKINHESLRLSSKINDSLSMALASKNLGYYFYDKSIDSAYFYNNKSVNLFKSLNDKFNTAVVLLDIALLQKDDKDFTGSELTSINALSLLNELEETNDVRKYKSFFYNNLALVFKMLEQYDESIEYNLKALSIQEKLEGDNKMTIDNQKNNLGNAYKESGQYGKAIDYYNEILKDKKLPVQRPGFYALVLDNYAHTLFKTKQLDQIPNLYFRALNICDSINDSYKSIVIHQHIAEYYFENNNLDSAKFHAYKAKHLSEQYYNDDLLKSLLLLSKIEKGDIAAEHLNAYIKLSDSLQKSERRIRNKFARIRFETDVLEQENIQIAKERMWLFIISVVVIMASFLLYLVVTQRNKNKELQFIQKQQETNEEIYNLMLSQNESIEEARTIEKKRISEELHDGVLGRLFGTRLSLDSLNFNNTPEAIKTRSQYIEELKKIEQDIRKVSHELNTDFVSGSGFIDIIKTLVETQSLAYKLDYQLKYDDDIHWDNINNKTKIHIYRIIQETLHNIYKHAQATKVDISFKLKKGVICLTITDNGSGFDVNKAKSGIGLKNMNSRINEISGVLNITSEIDKGTTVVIEVPTA
ncbi:tetratricopeptide repeat-containing sensor histidine kinase [Seonamhaeicola aphaedonensis]|nr:sensor histidine kinase [Seonamhaeicola aphaedonensis]